MCATCGRFSRRLIRPAGPPIPTRDLGDRTLDPRKEAGPESRAGNQRDARLGRSHARLLPFHLDSDAFGHENKTPPARRVRQLAGPSQQSHKRTSLFQRPAPSSTPGEPPVASVPQSPLVCRTRSSARRSLLVWKTPDEWLFFKAFGVGVEPRGKTGAVSFGAVSPLPSLFSSAMAEPLEGVPPQAVTPADASVDLSVHPSGIVPQLQV